MHEHRNETFVWQALSVLAVVLTFMSFFGGLL